MSAYEDYYKERCDVLELKVLSLLSQIETDNEIQAMHEIEYRKEFERLNQENKELKEKNKRLDEECNTWANAYQSKE